jgi:hypothetical protein
MALNQLGNLPMDVLERIAFYVATPVDHPEGPPSDLLSMLLVSRSIHSKICMANNKALYAAIFRYSFDSQAVLRRFSHRWSTDVCLSAELVKRFSALQRFRREIVKEDDLWTCVLM